MLTPTRSTTSPSRTFRYAVVPVAVLLTLGLLSISACGTGDGADAVTEQGSGVKGTGDSVQLLTYDSFALDDAAAAAFRKQTGAEIEVIAAGDSGSMLAGALLKAGKPEADVIFGIDNTSISEAVNGDLLEAYTPSGAGSLPADSQAPGGAAKQLTPIDTSEVCVNIDAQWFSEQDLAAPEDFEDLRSPAYKDLLVVESPVNSSPGLAFMLGSVEVFGADLWLDYWRSLKNNGVRVSPSWDDAYYNDYTVNGGDRPLVLSYASSPPAEVVFSDGELAEPSSEVADGTCVSQIEYAGVLKGARHPELARKLVDFMLDPVWQGALPLSNFVYPVTDADLPEEFLRWAPRPPDPVVLDAGAVDEHRDDWLEQWRSVME